MADFIPRTDGDLSLWLTNYKTKINTLGATVGLTPEEIAGIEAQCNSIIAIVNDAESKKKEASNAVTAKETLKKNELPVLRNTIKRIKTHSGYTEAIGVELGIIGSEESLPEKPVIKAKATANDVTISFTKKGFEGVNVYARLKGEAVWKFLARDTNSPYNDTRPLTMPGIPETREYKCIGVIADEEVSEASDIVSVVYGG